MSSVDHLFPVSGRISLEERWRRNGHRGGVVWFTGLSGSGKSTIALEVERRLFEHGYQTALLDGDNVRRGLNADLGFSDDDRVENIRRVGEVAALMAEAGLIVLVALISPFRRDRSLARAAAERLGPATFHEIYVAASLATCEARDPKGLYRKARAGEIGEFTGISSPYEPPQAADMVLDTERRALPECVAELTAYLVRRLAHAV